VAWRHPANSENSAAGGVAKDGYNSALESVWLTKKNSASIIGKSYAKKIEKRLTSEEKLVHYGLAKKGWLSARNSL
jgi:hypothetical protein